MQLPALLTDRLIGQGNVTPKAIVVRPPIRCSPSQNRLDDVGQQIGIVVSRSRGVLELALCLF
jgi:hypothetical protein